MGPSVLDKWELRQQLELEVLEIGVLGGGLLGLIVFRLSAG